MIRKLLLSIVVLVGLVSCSAFAPPPGDGSPTPSLDVQMFVQTAVVQTLAVETQLAQAVQETVAALPASTLPSPSPTTSAPTLTPTQEPSSTAFPPLFIITRPAIVIPLLLPTVGVQDFSIEFVAFDNCSGMRFARLKLTNTGTTTWESFEVVLNDQTTATSSSPMRADEFTDAYTCQETTSKTKLMPGENAIIYSQGFNHDLTQHQILASVTLCTLDGYAGQCLTKSLAIFSPSLTQAGFNVSYVNSSNCAGPQQNVFKFQLLNTGNVTWESMSVSFNDLDLNTSVPVSRDVFGVFNNCAFTPVNNLAPGGSIMVSTSNLPANPTGHQCMAYFTLCTQDGQAGTCINKTIFFVP